MPSVLSLVFEPGFFGNQPVRTALAIGGGAAVVSAVIGVFTVIRGQSFAGHALADVSSAGGSAAFLLGINPLLGFMAMAVLAACGIELIRTGQTRERDLVTGIAVGGGLGLSALFIYLDVTTHSTTGAAVTVMFGSMFAIPDDLVPPALAIGAGALAVVAAIYRPLLLASIDPDLAASRGVPVRLVGLLHLLVLSLAVSLSAITVGAVLSTALLIGPAAAALRLARRPGRAVAIAAAIGVGACWGGVLLAYDSYYWTPGRSWPVSFFIVTLIFVAYLAAGLLDRRPRRGAAAHRRRDAAGV